MERLKIYNFCIDFSPRAHGKIYPVSVEGLDAINQHIKRQASLFTLQIIISFFQIQFTFSQLF